MQEQKEPLLLLQKATPAPIMGDYIEI
jgi:hypothetical protein